MGCIGAQEFPLVPGGARGAVLCAGTGQAGTVRAALTAMSSVEAVPRSVHMRTKFLREVGALSLPDPTVADLVEADEILSLPEPALRFFVFSRVVGRPRVTSFRARWEGRFRMRPEQPWMPCEVWQYDTSTEIARIFHMRLRFFGVVPTYVRDTYVQGVARMAGRLFDAVPIVDDASEKVAVGELVTWLNDAVLFAPSMLLAPPPARRPWEVAFEAAGEDAFDVSVTDHGRTVRARVFVDARGAPVDFETHDRFGTDPADPKAGLVQARWTTPVESFVVLDEHVRPTRGKATWHFASGAFTYAELDALHADIAWNCPASALTDR